MRGGDARSKAPGLHDGRRRGIRGMFSAMSPVRIAIRRMNDVEVLSCTGSLTSGSGEQTFLRAVDDVLAAGGRIVVDLSELSYVDSAGVGSLVACGKSAASRGAVVKLAVSADGLVRRVLTVTQIDQAFEVFETAQAAADSFKG